MFVNICAESASHTLYVYANTHIQSHKHIHIHRLKLVFVWPQLFLPYSSVRF